MYNIEYYILLGTRNQFKHRKKIMWVCASRPACLKTDPVLYLHSVIYCCEVGQTFCVLQLYLGVVILFLWTLTLTGKTVVYCPLFTVHKCLVGSSLAAISRLGSFENVNWTCHCGWDKLFWFFLCSSCMYFVEYLSKFKFCEASDNLSFLAQGMCDA